MKKFPIFLLIGIVALALAMPSCGTDDNSTTVAEVYAEWKEKNDAWLAEQVARLDEDGNPYFTTLIPAWNPDAYVLIHYFNDRTLTEGNLSPLYTSTIDTRYYLTYYEGTAIDSSYLQTTYGPGIFRTQLSSCIEGWAIAFQDMRCGDTAEIVIPYARAYGVSTTSGIVPYSALKFNARLVDIPAYEINPNSL